MGISDRDEFSRARDEQGERTFEHRNDCFDRFFDRLGVYARFSDEVGYDLAVVGGVEYRALFGKFFAQFVCVADISVMRDRQRAFVIFGAKRLRVFLRIAARGRVSYVTDRDVAVHGNHRRILEHIADEPEAFLNDHVCGSRRRICRKATWGT